MNQRRIFVTGIAGTGKSTISQELKKNGINVIDIDHVPGLCAWINLETREKVHCANPDNDFIDQHDYQCDMAVLDQLMRTSSSPVVVFGCVGDNSTLLPLFDTIFLLQCSPETIIERLRTRNTNEFGKDKAVQERMLEWRKTFDALMLAAGAVPMNTDRDLAVVLEDLMNQIQE